MIKFNGIHAGDVGDVFEWFVDQRLCVSAAPKYATGACTFKTIRVSSTSNTLNKNCTLTLQKNGSNTTQTVTITAATNEIKTDSAHQITFAAGDTFDVVVTSNTATGTVNLAITIEIGP